MKKKKKKKNSMVPSMGSGYSDFVRRKTWHKDKRNKRDKLERLWKQEE